MKDAINMTAVIVAGILLAGLLVSAVVQSYDRQEAEKALCQKLGGVYFLQERVCLRAELTIPLPEDPNE